MQSQHLDPAQWKRIFDLLDTALDLPPEARVSWLDALDESSAGLKPALRQLLARHASHETSDFLERLPEFTFAEGAASFAGPDAPAVGGRVGPYRLLRELGHGGMGSVWLAERADGTFKRSVALKLPHVSWSDALTQRLNRERDILAGLEHPNIARLYEAGTDERGRPFLAMQYVEGLSIDQYCRQNNLAVRGILQLILQVTRALAHAHARLVVHRDLKPANILVSADGSVHLLDFGVAKLLEEDARQGARLTQIAGRAFTPDYAAPEQIMGEAITTATDVYALAVVTYELLTGSRPYRLMRGSAVELERAIAEVDVLLASDVASTLVRRRELRGDLDAILNKAMRKDPAARYPTAEAFANDVQRYLLREPVQARPDGSVYRMRKFVTRHRMPLAVAATVAVVLVAATTVSVWQSRVATEQKNRALNALDRNEAITDFVSLMLTGIATPGEPITIDDLLERSESLVSKSVTGNPEHQAVILQALASYYESFGNAAKAEPLLRRALSLAEGSSDRGLRARLSCQHARALSLSSDGGQSTQILERELSDPGVPADARAQCFRQRANIAQSESDASAMLRYVWEAWHTQRKAERTDPFAEAEILGDIGYAYTHVGDAAQADRYYAESIRKFTQIGSAEHPAANTVRNKWGVADLAVGDIKGALLRFDEALGIARRHAVGGEAPSYLVFNRAFTLFDMGRYEEAIPGLDEAIALARRTNNSPILAHALTIKGRAHLARGEVDEAQKYLDEVRAQLGRTLAAEGPLATGAQILHARISTERGDLDTALATYTRLAEFWQSRGMSAAPQMAAALRGRADVLLRQGKLDAALKDAERARLIVRKVQGGKPHSSLTGLAELLLSQIYARQGRAVEAKEAARIAFTHLSSALGMQSPSTRLARELLDAPLATPEGHRTRG